MGLKGTQQPKPHIEKPTFHNLRISIEKGNTLLTVVLSNTGYITKSKDRLFFSLVLADLEVRLFNK